MLTIYRQEMQMNNLKKIWANALIINCELHIGRNIRSVSFNLFQDFHKMKKGNISESKFIEICIEYFDNPVNDGKKLSKI